MPKRKAKRISLREHQHRACVIDDKGARVCGVLLGETIERDGFSGAKNVCPLCGDKLRSKKALQSHLDELHEHELAQRWKNPDDAVIAELRARGFSGPDEGAADESEKVVADYYITLHGLEYEQYFQGHGCTSRWTDCATGVGDSEIEALDDALDSLAQNGWEVSEIEKGEAGLIRDLKKMQKSQEEEIQEEVGEDKETNLHFYVSVDVK